MIKPEIKETPSDTLIAVPILITFFAGGDCSDKDGATAGEEPVAVVDAGVLDAIGKLSVGVEAVAVLDCLADCDGEIMLAVLASLRSGPEIMGHWFRSNALSQQPAAALALAPQQNDSVSEPLTSGHGKRLLCLSATLSKTIRDLL